MRYSTVIALLATLVLCGRARALELVDIPGTRFLITEEMTKVPVEISISRFSIAGTEISQAEFSKIMGFNPSFHKGDNLPVENVSWWEAIKFCNGLSEAEGLEPCYDIQTGECDYSRTGYRLPTNYEWAYADSNSVKISEDNADRFGNIGTANNESLDKMDQELEKNSTWPVGTSAANAFGLHDMYGNVWEWCSDYFDTLENTPYPFHNPARTHWSPSRTLRGGSFISLNSGWAKNYRSGMPPEYKSRFSGFRVCRTVDREIPESEVPETQWLEPYNRVPDGYRGNKGDLPALDVSSPANWQKQEAAIKAKWLKLLGWEHRPGMPERPAAELIHTYEEEQFTGELRYLQTEPDNREKIFVMYPHIKSDKPLPVVIVPYYDVDTPSGISMGGRSWGPPSVRSFGWLAVQHGFIVCCVRWFGESYGENYGESVANLRLRHPGLSGLGKWVWDSQRLLDYLCTLPMVDSTRIGIIGHSLGGKMSLYAAAFDSRIKAAVSSELGIGLTFSNYEDYWYYNENIRGIEKTTDHNELIALIAPRAYMLIGGDEFDTDKSWYYINSAREVYSLLGASEKIGYFDHRTGHTPSTESVHLGLQWLRKFLDNL